MLDKYAVFENLNNGNILLFKQMYRCSLASNANSTHQSVVLAKKTTGFLSPLTSVHKRDQSSATETFHFSYKYTVKLLLRGPPIQPTLSWVPNLASYISFYKEPLFSGHLYLADADTKINRIWLIPIVKNLY